MMQLIADIIDASLEGLFEHAIIDTPPDEMETFVTECEIESFWAGPGYDPYNFTVTFPVLRWQLFLWKWDGKPAVYYSLHLDAKPCPSCGEVVAPRDRRSGDGCVWCVDRRGEVEM